MNKKGENYLKWRMKKMHPYMQLNEDGKYTETLDGARMETINDLNTLLFIFVIILGILIWVLVNSLKPFDLPLTIILTIFIGVITYFCIGFAIHIKDMLNSGESLIGVYFKRRT